MKFTAILCFFLTLSMIFIPLIPIKQDNTVMTSTVQAENPKQNKTVPDKIKVYFTKKDKTEKIDLNEYISVDFSGYDTVGKATVTFDTEAYNIDYSEKIKYTKAFERNYEKCLFC